MFLESLEGMLLDTGVTVRPEVAQQGGQRSLHLVRSRERPLPPQLSVAFSSGEAET